MKRVVVDLLILVLIATPVVSFALLMPQDNLRIEKNWGSLIYSPPVTTAEANAVVDVLVQYGVFAGTPISFKLQRDADTWTLMMVSKRTYENTVSREMLKQFGLELCAAAFPGQNATFVLIDEDQEPFEVLIEPTLFPED